MSEFLSHEKWEELQSKYGSDAYKLVEFRQNDLESRQWQDANNNLYDVDWTLDSTNYDLRLKQRSFKKGDLVTGHTVYRPYAAIVGEIVGFEHGYPVVHVEDGDNVYVYIRDFVIKHIRTPRKGSEEARGIVAIAAAYYRAKLNRRFSHMMIAYDNDKKLAFQNAKEYARDSVIYSLYQEQKAMLK
jgi:hypothetical protein